MPSATAAVKTLAILTIFLLTLPAAAAVSVEAQNVSIIASAGSACDSPPNANPDREYVASNGPGDVSESFSVNQSSGCGNAVADAALTLEIREGEIRGSLSASISLDDIGNALADATALLVLVADEATPFRMEVSRSFAEAGDEPQMSGAFAAIENSAMSVEAGNLIVFEGTLEAGVSRELLATTAFHRASLGLADGSFISATGDSSGSVDFTIRFESEKTVANQRASFGDIKSRF